MKESETMQKALGDLTEIKTTGDLRRLVSNTMLALARKEISATDALAMAKGLDAISNSLQTEVKVARARNEMLGASSVVSEQVKLGHLVIGE